MDDAIQSGTKDDGKTPDTTPKIIGFLRPAEARSRRAQNMLHSNANFLISFDVSKRAYSENPRVWTSRSFSSKESSATFSFWASRASTSALRTSCFLENLSGVRMLTTFYLAKNDHRWVIFTS